MEAGQEKRQYVRLNVMADVIYSKCSEDEKDKSFAKNISKGGICLIAYEELKKEDVLSLNIYLPEHEAPISATGKVAWTKEFSIGDPSDRKFDVGIEFVDIKDDDRSKIDKYVFTHLPGT